MNNVISNSGYAIVIQSCDENKANVGIFCGGKSVYHHVSIPDLEREWKPVYYSDLQDADYDRILLENKLPFLVLIEQLNAPNNRLHLDVGDSPAQGSLFTPEADTAEGKLPAPAPRR